MEITVVNIRPELFPYYRKLGYVDVGPEGRRAVLKREPLHRLPLGEDAEGSVGLSAGSVLSKN